MILKGHVRHMTRGWWCGLARLDPSTRRVDGFPEHHVYGSGDVGINKWPPQPTTTTHTVYTLLYTYTPNSTYDTCVVTWTSPSRSFLPFLSPPPPPYPIFASSHTVFPSFFRERKCTLTTSINCFSIP